MTSSPKRIAIVTGGSRGIGLGIVKRLLQDQFSVMLNGVRPEESVTDVLQTLRETGGDVAYCAGDISDPQARENLIAATRETFGALHVLVNNAGVAPKVRADILDATADSYDWVMDVNLKGPYFLTQLAARWMIEQKQADAAWEGSIINVNSVSATVVSVNRGEYCISKAGLAMATGLWAARLGEYHIPVYEVRPGVTATDMTAGVTEKYDKLIAEGLTVTPRWGYPEDVGKAVAALARGDFPYSTGQVIMVDGGLTVPRL
ncbi:MAG: 3-ketoacyl-ACP reductase [Verrucomicrobia bacterium]|nr:3-ketoacyl-ACP reductase [Verrucomicrobiota bacterium]MCH8526703.1 3-ketoacyl-ACP reductase [Kiritimatiellia bacterium]